MATAYGGKGLTLLVTQHVATMRSTAACGPGNSRAKIIRVGVFLRILTGVHNVRTAVLNERLEDAFPYRYAVCQR